jgi:hypothetical protein
MSWIKKLPQWAFLYVLLPLMIVELLLVTFVFFGVVNFDSTLIPTYLKQGEARLINDESGAPIYVDGSKKYFKTVYFDSRGFLLGDFDRLANGNDNVIFLGDSYTEALQVEQHETFSSLIDEYYPSKNVINLGVGGTGTISQMLRYKSVRSTPNISDVFLFFLPQNDVFDNHPKYHEQFGLPNAPYYTDVEKEPIVKSKVEKEPIVKSKFREVIRNVAKQITVARIVYQAYLQNLNVEPTEETEQIIDGSIFYKDRLVMFDVFGKPPNLFWEEAWGYTERALLELKALTDEDGVNLHIVIVADSLQIYHYNNPLEKYDFNYPNNRLMSFCSENELNCHNSLPYFIKYLVDNDLKFPYFSFKNDGHYGSLGHKVMASYLQDLDLLN